MTVGFLTGKLAPYTEVIIKDWRDFKEVWRGNAGLANFNDTVRAWDFSNEHVIYIGPKEG